MRRSNKMDFTEHKRDKCKLGVRNIYIYIYIRSNAWSFRKSVRVSVLVFDDLGANSLKFS